MVGHLKWLLFRQVAPSQSITLLMFFCILTKCLRYKSGPYLTQSVYRPSEIAVLLLYITDLESWLISTIDCQFKK